MVDLDKRAETRSSDPPRSSDAGNDSSEARLRVLLGVIGIGLLLTGAVAAFVKGDGVTTAAVLAAGFALVFVGYLGRNITRIKFRDFEAELATVQRKVAETVSVLDSLETAARRYEATRAEMRSGGGRDAAMETVLAEAEKTARASEPPLPVELAELFASDKEGDRITALALMKAHPDLRNPELVLKGIERFHKPFDHDRFMALAAEVLHKLDEDQERRLRELIERQRAEGVIKDRYVRWATSERLLRLMRR